MLENCIQIIPEGDYIFSPSADLSVWSCVNCKDLEGFSLASFLRLISVVIDDDCHFCRIIRNNDNIQTIIIYRAYSSKRIRITISHYPLISF